MIGGDLILGGVNNKSE